MARTGRARALGLALGLLGVLAPSAAHAGLGPAVTVEGSPVEGQTLTMTSHVGPPLEYAWERCPQAFTCPDFLGAGQAPWTTIPGANTGTYTLTGADVGHYIRAVAYVITARPVARRGGSGTPFTSQRLGPVTPAGTAPPVEALPPPTLHETANLDPVEGVVLIREPGSTAFRRLETAEQVPLGSTVDATNGEVAVVTARNESGTLQTGWFWAGAFVLDQAGGQTPVTRLELAGPFANGAARTAAQRKRGGDRRLWGRGRCKCRTEGRNSSGTARGTKWLTIDRQRKTITKVKRGKVAVRDFEARRTVVVKAGEQYVARAGG